MIEALWFFLPAYFANQCPGLARYFNLPLSKYPVHAKLLGENKTIAAYYSAPIGALLVLAVQQCLSPQYSKIELLMLGMLFGIGAVLGDHTESFIKRRLGKVSGEIWWPFDQIDFAIGALIVSYPISGWIGYEKVFYILFIAIIFHPIINGIGLYLGIRKTWL